MIRTRIQGLTVMKHARPGGQIDASFSGHNLYPGSNCCFQQFFLNINGRTHGHADIWKYEHGDIWTNRPSYRDSRMPLKKMSMKLRGEVMKNEVMKNTRTDLRGQQSEHEATRTRTQGLSNEGNATGTK